LSTRATGLLRDWDQKVLSHGVCHSGMKVDCTISVIMKGEREVRHEILWRASYSTSQLSFIPDRFPLGTNVVA